MHFVGLSQQLKDQSNDCGVEALSMDDISLYKEVRSEKKASPFAIPRTGNSPHCANNDSVAAPRSSHQSKIGHTAEDSTEDGSGSKCCEFQNSSKLSSSLDCTCGSAKNNWLDEETH